MNRSLNIQEWDKVLAILNRKLAKPTMTMPSVHVFTEKVLNAILRDSLAESCISKQLSGIKLLTFLADSGLGERVELEDEGKTSSSCLWTVGVGVGRDTDPLELLQAAKPQDVICYFSALSYHNLTTQMVPHYHISHLNPKVTMDRERIVAGSRSQRVPSLGSLLFRYEGMPYYYTRRILSQVPGVKTYYLSPRTIIRITDLEQTLLDTLHRPWSCGGAAVVMEAWENGMKMLDQERLADYLIFINSHLLTRRAGCMLDQFSFRIEALSLECLLNEAEAASSNMPVEFLLPTIPGYRVDQSWNLEIGG